jgi:hypothetical protein
VFGEQAPTDVAAYEDRALELVRGLELVAEDPGAWRLYASE